MSNGKFNTPRSLGSVTDIRPTHIKIRLDELGYRIDAVIEESEDVGGELEKRFDGEINLMASSLTSPQRTTFRNFMKLLVNLYITQEDYTDVTVS